MRTRLCIKFPAIKEKYREFCRILPFTAFRRTVRQEIQSLLAKFPMRFNREFRSRIREAKIVISEFRAAIEVPRARLCAFERVLSPQPRRWRTGPRDTIR